MGGGFIKVLYGIHPKIGWMLFYYENVCEIEIKVRTINCDL